MDLLKQLNWRYATKHFNPDKKINSEDLDTILNATNLAPSSYGLQPYKVLVIEDAKIKTKLKEVGFQQPQFTDASHIIVFAANSNVTEKDVDDFMLRIAETRRISKDNLADYKAVMLNKINRLSKDELTTWASKQCYIGLGFLLYTAAQISIDACPMEGFDNKGFDEVLGLKDKNLTSVVVASIGYRADEDKYQYLEKVRYPIDELIIKY